MKRSDQSPGDPDWSRRTISASSTSLSGGAGRASFRKHPENHVYRPSSTMKRTLRPSASDAKLARLAGGGRPLGIRRTSSALALYTPGRTDASEYRLHPPSAWPCSNCQHTPLASLNNSINHFPSSSSIAIDNPQSQSDTPHHTPRRPRSATDIEEPKEKRSFFAQARDVKDRAVTRARRGCTKKLLYKRLPILQWLPKYTTEMAVSDLISGITVGLTILPQAIAFSNIAGIPPQYGLYSSFFGCFVYTLLGSSKDSSVGPSSIQAIITRENVPSADFAVLLCFFAGIIELIMGILQMGFIIDFISGPVSIGFTSAAAIIIGTTQVKNILGINIEGGQFVDMWRQIFDHIGETRLWDTVLGFGSIITLFLLKSLQGVSIGPKEMSDKTTLQKVLHHMCWLISVARNIVVVVLCGVMAYVFHSFDENPFKLTGYVKPGLPTFQPPPFSSQVGNTTYSFTEMTTTLSSGTFVIAILAIVENIATAKVFANGKTIDATQEMLAIGVSNILSSFVGSMPITGALSRGAVNNASGVKTTFGGIYTGILVLVSLAFFTPYFFYIPKASLAAVIIMAVVTMIEYQVVTPIWKTKKMDLLPAFVTFLSCLLIRLEVGLMIGIAINVLFLLYASARPHVEIEYANSISGCEYLLLTPDRSLVFPSVEYVRGQVSKAGIKHAFSWIPVVIDCTHIHGIDFTTAKGVKSLMDDFSLRKQMIIFYNLKPNIVGSFQAVKPKDFVVCYNLMELDDLLRENLASRKSQVSLSGISEGMSEDLK